MKRALKILIPLILILALLIFGYWYFFRYRTDVTANALIRLGDSKIESGSYDAAIRYYSWAIDLQPQDADLSLNLAEAYRNTGNLTKTERVLVNAIYSSPDDTRLYVALSKTYVEQDKLLDAQQLLDNIANETVLNELTSRRPAPPAISPEGGYYSEYITVSLSPGDDATCYFTTNGQYPSLASDAYSEPVELEGGETTVCALAVDDEGLVSPAVYVGYTIAGVVEDVTFADKSLEATVQEMLHRGGRTLQTDDLWEITDLTLPEGVTTLEDLSYFTGLERLTAHDLGELDYSALLSMPQLSCLDLSGCTLTTENLQTIGSCAGLETLILSDCGLSNITPLGTLSGLRTLDLSDNSINNIDAIVGCAGLETLDLGHNAMTKLPILSSWKGLQKLNLSYNALTSVTSLTQCSALQELDLSHNRLTGITSVSALPLLTSLDASNNQIEDVSTLRSCTALVSFRMAENKLTSIDFLENVSTITYVNVDYNDIEAVPHFPEDCVLAEFSAAHNFLNDLSGLSGLKQLSYVNADYNNITDISVLEDCPNLNQVNVYGTFIHDGGALADRGVIVNFTPVID